MSFSYNATGIEMSGNFELIPEGDYPCKIVSVFETISKNGDPMVKVDYEIIDGAYIGKQIKFHHVTFLGKDETGKSKKGAGMALNYLKTIGEPYQGDIIVDPESWVGKKLSVKVVHEKGFDGVKRSNVKWVNPISDFVVSSNTDVPF